MNALDRQVICELTEQLGRVLRGDFSTLCLSVPPGPELSQLADLIERLIASLREAQEFITTLSQGELDAAAPPRNHLVAPFKQLQANLRHLTWQTQQIAAGDLNQKVDFLGEFSVAFNALTEALRQKHEAEEKVRYLSHHDPLTKLYNRGYFEEEMARIERGRRFPVSIMMADLDGLKKINDTMGHAVGDRLLGTAADVLRRSVRAEDVVARVGGDEFALILPETDAATVAGVLARIRENEQEFNRQGHDFPVLISIGVATVEEGASLTDAMKTADERMYRDKFTRKERRRQEAEGR